LQGKKRLKFEGEENWQVQNCGGPERRRGKRALENGRRRENRFGSRSCQIPWEKLFNVVFRDFARGDGRGVGIVKLANRGGLPRDVAGEGRDFVAHNERRRYSGIWHIHVPAEKSETALDERSAFGHVSTGGWD